MVSVFARKTYSPFSKDTEAVYTAICDGWLPVLELTDRANGTSSVAE